MNPFSWKKTRTENRLSAYLDGELGEGEAARVGELLALNPQACQQLRAYTRLSALTRAALAPERIPDAAAFADRLARVLAAPEAASPPRRLPASRVRHLAPAVLVSIGILATAGIALVGLRRRGLV
jgi:anti-sigma factor RsiW